MPGKADSSDIILHIASRSDWQAGRERGEYRAPSLVDEGFIHASADEGQMLQVAARLFAGRTDLLLLVIDTRLLSSGSPVIREPAPSGEIYPHIYGPINLAAVVQVHKLVPAANAPGHFALVEVE